jgi:deazaflavin-dependent oxidoreductase (nitroreductase family)
MPLPARLARFNRHVTNRVFGLVAGWLPWFAIVHHRGRRSGRALRTPLNAFPNAGGYVIALTYGPNVDWVKNILAAGGAELETGRRRVRVTAPRMFVDQRQQVVPPPVRIPLRVIGVTYFLELKRA